MVMRGRRGRVRRGEKWFGLLLFAADSFPPPLTRQKEELERP
jgi:hypothetical protein